MDKYLKFVWLIATVTSWISFGFASWEWADNFDSGMLMLMILWFVMSLILFMVGLRFRKPSS
ncbi:MAG TPA: hypothetical protein VJ821_13475 [Anaerolineales bacterium]|nr:hypothetical protein [Anaerolineales bacterium]